MRKICTAALLAASIALSGCATPVVHNTPSGRVEATIPAPSDAVKSQLVGFMMNRGYNVSKDTPYMISFDKQSTNLLANVLLGSKYDAVPNVRVTYTLMQVPPAATRVVADFSIVTNPGSAFERITRANGSQDTVEFQSKLDQLAIELNAKK